MGFSMFFQPRGEVDNSKYYNVLGVDKSADTAEIGRAFRALAREHHPDKGGDAEYFKTLQLAKEVLSDPQKRVNYDRFGEDGADRGPSDIADMFWPNQRAREAGQKKGKDLMYPLRVTLDEVYNGAVRKLRI